MDNEIRLLSDRKAIMVSLSIIIFADMIGLGLILPILPQLISSLSDVSIGRAAEIGGLLLFVYALMQFLFAPIIGGLSDRFGRRSILLITLVALGMDYFLMALAPTLAWLFVGRLISGIMGATWAAANSCIADIFDPKERSANFGKLGAAGGAGLVMGPAIGGLLGQYGARIPFYAAGILCLLGAIFAYFKLQETLPKNRRRAFEWKRANPLGNLLQMIKKPFVMGLLICILCMHVASQSQVAVWAFYLIEKFSWNEFHIGLSITLYGILLAIVQGGCVGPAIKRFGDRKTALYSMILIVPAYMIFAFAEYGWVVIIGIFVGSLGGFAFPAMQGMMTTRIDENAQGELQGAIASIISLGSIIGPVSMTFLFGAFTKRASAGEVLAGHDGAYIPYFPGAPFILSTILIIIALLIFVRTIGKFYSDFGKS